MIYVCRRYFLKGHEFITFEVCKGGRLALLVQWCTVLRSRPWLDSAARRKQQGLLLLIWCQVLCTEVDCWVHRAVLVDLQWMVFEMLVHEQLPLINNKVVCMYTIARVDILRIDVLGDGVRRVPPVLKWSELGLQDGPTEVHYLL